jgi:hypothetical protein
MHGGGPGSNENCVSHALFILGLAVGVKGASSYDYLRTYVTYSE